MCQRSAPPKKEQKKNPVLSLLFSNVSIATQISSVYSHLFFFVQSAADIKKKIWEVGHSLLTAVHDWDIFHDARVLCTVWCVWFTSLLCSYNKGGGGWRGEPSWKPLELILEAIHLSAAWAVALGPYCVGPRWPCCTWDPRGGAIADCCCQHARPNRVWCGHKALMAKSKGECVYPGSQHWDMRLQMEPQQPIMHFQWPVTFPQCQSVKEKHQYRGW